MYIIIKQVKILAKKTFFRRFLMFKVVNSHSICLNTYGRSVNIYVLMDVEKGKFSYAIDDYDGKKKKKRIKILDDSLNEKTVYSRHQLSKMKFLELQVIALQQEINNQEMLKNQFERWYNEKKELLSTIKELVDSNNILELKELLSKD